MAARLLSPDYVLEASWEVCNKVGGIYTVLSTRAKTLQDKFTDHVIFIGPDLGQAGGDFTPDEGIFPGWAAQAEREGIKARTVRWEVPGRPIAVLVDFGQYYQSRNGIYARAWEDFQVDSLHGYGDYDEASMFSLAAAKAAESLCRHALGPASRVVYHAHEWMAGLGMLYIRKRMPQVATVFTTHATSVGRSIAGNGKPLYDFLHAYDGDQMARELNVESKHSVEKRSAWNADCFTTVSDITARECAVLLGREVDTVLPNGFEDGFVPRGRALTARRAAARERLLRVANALLGTDLGDDTLIVSTSGRYEFRNKGIDLFIEAMGRLSRDGRLERRVLAFITVPGWVGEPRRDLAERMRSGAAGRREPLDTPVVTHWLRDMDHDSVLGALRRLGMGNGEGDGVKVVFVPCYLDGKDGILDMPYYDLMPGNDLCVYPSYYEPWGYTPLEATAFHVPCVTSDLAGFGQWAEGVRGTGGDMGAGVGVVHRDDGNYHEAADRIRDMVAGFSRLSPSEAGAARSGARALSRKALWRQFIGNYYRAYDIALRKAEGRRAAMPAAAQR